MRPWIAIFGLVVLVTVAGACGDEPMKATPAPTGKSVTAPPPRALTDQEGQIMLNGRCATCHSTTPIKKAHLTAEEWAARLENTECRKATGLSRADKRALIHYLIRKYGK